MKLKLLLLFLFIVNLTWAQEPYNNLIITEARMVAGDFNDSYFEITNMGDSPIDLSEIKFAKGFRAWVSDAGGFFYLPPSVSKVLQPGESYVLTIGLDFGLNMYNARIPGYGNADRAKKHDIYQYADFIAHREEKDAIELVRYANIQDSAIYSPDSAYTNSHYVFQIGHLHLLNKGIWLEHHFAEGDSAIIDQVGNMFDDATGKNTGTAWDVAGVNEATANSILVRKSIIKTGNLDFNNSRGVGLDDSEWLPLVPADGEDNWRDTWWTVGNHGDFVLDENTLEPKKEGIVVDFTGKKITVPWGTKRLDDIMRNMKYKPGVAWKYHLNASVEDSLYRSAQTGDQLTVYVVGETLYTAVFDIEVSEPTESDNLVVPIAHASLDDGPITNTTQFGKLGWPRVTQNESGMDYITGGGYGLPNELRADSLLKYLEKPANASWEIIYVDGAKRADLKTGDILKVTAQNGDVKEYYIETQGYTPSHNANMSSITWPDIDLPDFFKEIYEWQGDTIPKFNTSSFGYRIQLPFDYEGIPALIPKTQDLNATVNVDRATTLSGSIDDRTTSFEITAEDDSVKTNYKVELIKEKDPRFVQPYHAEPFLAQIIYKTNGNNIFLEICNPGNQPMDLSNYMFCAKNTSDPSAVITSNMDPLVWTNRFEKYVPGFKWVSQADWAVSPGILVPDINVPRIVQPGDVFCMGTINNDNHLTEDMVWNVPLQLDVQFWNKDLTYGSYINPWGEDVGQGPVPNTFTEEFYMFKILNDSIQKGLKPANDPNDFELMEAVGMAEGGRWYVAGSRVGQRVVYTRKPEYITANPTLEASFGTNEEDSEWIVRDRPYYSSRGIGQPQDLYIMESDLGQHFFNEPTHYMSTISAVVYKVSPGYSMNESIRGIITGTSVSTFLSNIFKADEGQTLTLKSGTDATVLASDAMVSLNDTLVVLSADSTNTSKYVLNVAEIGLDANALLTSTRYDVKITAEPKSATNNQGDAGTGEISGFEYGTSIRTVLANVTKPAAATISIIDGAGAYIPVKRLNFDTTYVNVTVNTNTYFEVVAEDGVTKIMYQLLPEASENDLFVLSDVYEVNQKNVLIKHVPEGTAVKSLLANLVASEGAMLKIVDKYGYERLEGNVANDDKIVVISGTNETLSKVYFISKLATEYILETTYLAYITSNVYGINQVDNVIHGVSTTELVSEVYSKITPSLGANAVIVDSNGAEKTSGDINRGDRIKVTSADGKITVSYSFGTLTGIDQTDFAQFELYPNPTNSKINIRGLNPGNRIQVFNSVGVSIVDIVSQGIIETISLDDEATGLYLIVISDKNELLGRYKAVKR